MAANSLDVMDLVDPDDLALTISRKWEDWTRDRSQWESRVKELRDYIYATDTKTTTNNKLPFHNTTITPKLMQIKMNLHSNYMSNLFPNDIDWINWEAHDRDSAEEDKRSVIESYARTKSRQQNLVNTFGTLLDDWIIYGNCFSKLEFVNESVVDKDGNERKGYIGPKLIRVSPFDVAFNLAATDFRKAPKIHRMIKSIGDIAKDVKHKPELGYTQELLDRMTGNRREIRENAKRISRSEIDKSRGLIADGFSSIEEYYNSDLVEILEFYGDLWDDQKGELLENHVITVIDRAFIVRKEPSNSWTGAGYLYHSPWGRRPDNLMGYGPLDNLVGMQYKIDKLENLRADVFEQIAYPTKVEVGTVEFYGVRGAPGGRYVVDEGGAVQDLRPDATALNADLQIAQTMQLMEEMAGSPKESMGFRTPGEKTKFEVQVLDNAANRIFRRKVEDFELLIEEVMNDFIEMARRNLNVSDVIRSLDPQFGIESFLEVTGEDLMGNGKLYPRGSKHVINQANNLQNLVGIANSPLFQLVAPHLSRFGLAKVIEDLLGVEKFALIAENQGIMEDVDSQRVSQAGAKQLTKEMEVDPQTGEQAAFQQAPEEEQ